jgi:hypothetical protein
MAREALVTRIGQSAILCVALSTCGGEMIRLGDATGESDELGSPGGSAGVASTGGAGASGTTPVASGTGGASLASSGAGGHSASSGASGEGGNNCEPGSVSAAEVLFIGDSWLTMPDNRQTERVREHALAAGKIDPAEHFANRAAAAASMADIANQYAAQQAGPTKAKVLLMDGGTWDPIAAQMAGGSIPDAIEQAIATFREFLVAVSNDGTVEHIVYFLVPPLPAIPGVDAMRPELQDACAASAVPCHFIDLRDTWANNPGYTGMSGIQASAAGADVIGDLLWQKMQENCIAQ